MCVFMPAGGACSVYAVCMNNYVHVWRGPCLSHKPKSGSILYVLQQGVTDAVVLVTGSTEANISINTSCYYNLKVL